MIQQTDDIDLIMKRNDGRRTLERNQIKNSCGSKIDSVRNGTVQTNMLPSMRYQPFAKV